MFNRRMKVFLIVLLVASGIVIVRLGQLQVARAHQYQEMAEDALRRRPRYIPFVRGRILDRNGRLLASDQPSWDICMDYGALSGDEDYVKETAREWRRNARIPSYEGLGQEEKQRRYEEAVTKRIEDSFAMVAELTHQPLDEVMERRDQILKRVAAIQRDLLKRRGYYVEPGEMRIPHPVVRGLEDQLAVHAKVALAELDWLCVRASTQRVYTDDPSMGHIMGRLGQVTAEAIQDDPRVDDELGCYKAWETFGVAGVERLCEQMLRGKRGKIEQDYDRRELQRIEPIDGPDAALTIDVDLQRKIYEILAKAVKGDPLSTGGAAVVLHIPTREILALVSYPGYNANLFLEKYESLLHDTRGRPTLFRAVAGVYPPGSVVKPATLATALALNLITPETRLNCHGYLYSPNGRFKCWIYNKYHMSHNQQFPAGLSAEEALQVSCNCYFYQLGEKIHGDRLCQWFRQFWIGPPGPAGAVTGTGLIEERSGILPTAAWLWEHQRRPMRAGDSRNYAIGQGEMGLTPLQVASLMATIACGHYQWPTIVANDGRQRPVWDLGIKQSDWRTVRNGLYRVVNNPKGTAYGQARMDDIVVAGKTGSAQCSRIPISRRFVVEYPDGRREKIVAKHRHALERRLRATPGAKIVSSVPCQLWPPRTGSDGKSLSISHAWFGGFVPGDPGGKPEFAISALVEFGESGGRKAGPVAKEIIHALMDSPNHYLQGKTSHAPI